MIKQQNKSKEQLDAAIQDMAGVTLTWTYDSHSNPAGWLTLEQPETLTAVAKKLAQLKVRLCTMTAYTEERDHPEEKKAIAYHFAYNNVLFTVIVPLYSAASTAQLAVPSITPWFHNADWNEREFSEMYNITIIDHPNPRRLFLDERLDAGIMAQLVPFSAMVHGAGSKNLWEQVMAARGEEQQKKDLPPHLTPGTANESLEEPTFTPVATTKPQA